MATKKSKLDQLLDLATPTVSKWELDNIVWNDRTSNPKTLTSFLQRIKFLQAIEEMSIAETQELIILLELADDLDLDECRQLLSTDDEHAQRHFIEELARRGALETLCNDALSIETMAAMCKLSPNDFILAAKRSQDIINAIRELVIQGETLSSDVAGA